MVDGGGGVDGRIGDGAACSGRTGRQFAAQFLPERQKFWAGSGLTELAGSGGSSGCQNWLVLAVFFGSLSEHCEAMVS